LGLKAQKKLPGIQTIEFDLGSSLNVAAGLDKYIDSSPDYGSSDIRASGRREAQESKMLIC